MSVVNLHKRYLAGSEPACRPLAAEDGQSLVELALVLPVLLAIVMGILWFGRALNYSTDETHLANEAARYAAVNSNPGAPSQSLNNWIRGQIDTSELREGKTTTVPNPAALSICFPNGTSNVGDPVKVSITSTFHFVPILNLAPVTITRSAVMRIEVAPTNYTATGAC